MATFRLITLKAGRTQKNLNRLTKWAGFEHDFSGRLHSAKWWGYKVALFDGSINIHLWPQVN